MRARTVKGNQFTIQLGDKRIVIKHVAGKGKRCRVTVPQGVTITSSDPDFSMDDDDSDSDRDERLR